MAANTAASPPPVTAPPPATKGYLTQTPQLTAREEALIAYRRLGLGYKKTMPDTHWTDRGAAYAAIKAELANPNAARVEERPMGIRPDGRQLFTGTLDLYGVPTAIEAGYSSMGENHQHWLQGDLRAHFRMAQKPAIGFVERLVLFWSNHFSVCRAKDALTQGSTGHLERTAIRPHVLGRFADMLKAVIGHPAMIDYLDNQMNIGPNSTRDVGRHLNENLARELLELHTLGQGNYTQQDIMAMAKLLTGYVISTDPGQSGQAKWDLVAHEMGDFTLLDRLFKQTYQGYPGHQTPEWWIGQQQRKSMTDQRQVLEALDFLAVHPFTATHLATKMLRHFIADEPKAQDIATLAKSFSDSGGDLGVMAQTLLDMPVTWSLRGAPRITTPQMSLAAINRALNLSDDAINALSSKTTAWLGAFEAYLGPQNHNVWMRQTPDGYPDRHADWFSDAAIRLRIDLIYEYLKAIEATRLFTLPDASVIATTFRRQGALRHLTYATAISTQLTDNKAKLTNLFMSNDFLRRI